MSYPFENLQPKLVWEHFYRLNQIPRCSGHEEAAGRYAIQVAEKNHLPWEKDAVGNIKISIPATPGMENRPGVVLQGHLDMVCEKNKETVHDFSKDPIRMLIDNGWVRADGTTLGADNGIAVAMALAVLEDKSLTHPPVELLFTVDEETGLTGAVALKSDFLKNRYLLNIDSEEEGALYIGCAGGKHTFLRKKIDWVARHADHKSFLLKVSGLRGGHSGLNIHEGFGNAIKLLARVLYNLDAEFHYHLGAVNAGSKHNAIPRQAEALIDVPADTVDALKKHLAGSEAIFREELKFVDKGVQIQLEPAAAPDRVFGTDFRKSLVNVLYAMPHGVAEMSHAIPGLVETSTNMAIIETKGDMLEMLTSQRSSLGSAVLDIADKVAALGELGGFEVEQGGGYPAWAPNPDSKLLKICSEIYSARFGQKPAVKAIHAGLECGIIGEKYDGMDMISFGPDITGAHSPDEKIRIESVAHVWEFLTGLLKNIR